METISNTTCTKCQCCGEWTNYADDAHHKAREARVAELNSISMSLAADVLKEIGLDEGRTADRIRARVVKWRGQWDAVEARQALAKEGG